MRFATLAVLILPASIFAQAPENTGAYVKQHYARTNVRIAARDGTQLFTVIYAPKDTSQTYPILITRTPYGVHPYEIELHRNALGPNAHFLSEKYIFVYQDVRGRYMSDGVFENVRPQSTDPKGFDESTDTYDSIDWLLRNVPNNNGKVGLWGISYGGFYTSAGMINAHPALKAASPQAPIADWFFDDFFHHGTFFLPHAFNFFSRFGKPRPSPTTERTPDFKYPTNDGYRFYLEPLKSLEAKHFKGSVAYWHVMAEHPNYDEFWQARNILPHLKKVAPAVLTVGGWFDAEDLYGVLKTHRAIEKLNPGVGQTLVMGPWVHGGWSHKDASKLGQIPFGDNTAVYYQRDVELPFFNFHLKGKGEQSLPKALMFETGMNRWRRFEQWPPAQAKTTKYYLNAGNALTTTPTKERGEDAFPSDPRKPVPFTPTLTTRMVNDYMVEDQRFVWNRPDVLAYSTEPLTEAVTVAGPLLAKLTVSTTCTDADWIVKLIDVHPDGAKTLSGYQMLVRSEAIRGRFRESYSKPKPFVPNEPAAVDLELLDVLHTFRPGHRIMIQICSTWFPLIDRNPQKYVPNIFRAEESDFQPAVHRIHRGSHVELSVLR